MSVGIFQILIIALIVLVLFGRGRISEMMGDVGEGIKSFRKGLSDTDQQLPAPVADAAPAIESVPGDKTTR